MFAVHPLHVESVAWIIERKDVLSALFYLAAVLAWLRLVEVERARHYVLAVVLFTAGLLSKSVVVTLPLALLIVQWWRGGRVTRLDLLRVAPLVVIGAAVTAADLAFYRGREVLELGYTLAERVLIAGRALWFYAGKLVWPAELAVIYPLWEIEAGSLAGWAYVAAAAGLALLLWLGRERIGRGPLAEALYFALTLGPVLGFVDYGYMQFSFVADRFQYLAGSGVLAVLIGAAAHGVGRLRAGERDAAGVHEASVAVLRLDALLPSTGSGAATVPPLHQYYGGAKTPRCPSRRASLPSLGDTMPAPAGSLLCFLGCRSAQAWTLLCRRPSGSPVMETNEAPRFLGHPLRICPALGPRPGRRAKPSCGTPVLPPLIRRRRPQQEVTFVRSAVRRSATRSAGRCASAPTPLISRSSRSSGARRRAAAFQLDGASPRV